MRAPAIWPRTQEVLSGLGVLDAFLAAGITIDELRLWDADRDRVLLSIPLRELEADTPLPQLLILPQSRTEALLCEAVQREPTGRVLFSSEVTGLRQNDASVSVEYRRGGRTRTVEPPFAIGCDGARSTVRESLGISLEGETYEMRVALADGLEGGRRIIVQDNGWGVEAQSQNQVFQRFFREHPEVEDTGLGLSIAKRVVEQRGGLLWFESEPGEGTTFFMEIPQRLATSEQQAGEVRP